MNVQFTSINEQNLNSIFLETYYFSALILYSWSGNIEQLEKYLVHDHIVKSFKLNNIERNFLYMIASYNKKDYIACITKLREIQDNDKDKTFYFQTKLIEANIFLIQKLPMKSINILNMIYKEIPEQYVPKMNLIARSLNKQYPKLKTFILFGAAL